ncbi:MAG: hypothetical protein IKH05_08040 [Bacteroidaceae bacterium]|nr:hypothetical protein [Bacteroidaceae bacterium]
MRKVNPLDPQNIITMIILLMSICIKVYAQSPYGMFGDNSKMLEAKRESVPSIYRVGIQSNNGVNLYADFDLKKGLATLYDAEGNVLRQDSISENTKAMFTTIDPHAESYYHLSPYSYCGGNPVNRIDPTGMDWYQNNQTSYYTWYDGDGAREGFTYIGGVGSLLGEFESKINNILIDVYKNNNGLYSEGRTVDITNPNKGAIFPSQLSQMDDFLDEFVFGYGPEISILTSNHPYTKSLQSDACVIESQQNLRAGNTTIPGQITKVNRSWGPLDALSTTSIAKQFVGSYTFDSYTSNDKKHLLNIIYDTKNFRSLFYHIPGTG